MFILYGIMIAQLKNNKERGGIMKIAVDTHTHTISSGHAYNTIREMASMAAEKGLEALAITDHAPTMPGSAHLFYFSNLKVVPREFYGIRILLGSELNILNEDGEIDLPEKILNTLDITVASIHTEPYGKSKGIEKNTAAYLNAMKNRNVDIIGHPDDGRFEVNYELLVETAVQTGTLLEINNSSMKPNAVRQNAYENNLKILAICKKAGAGIVLSSDAHVDTDIANTLYTARVVQDAQFPEELIMNTSYQKLMRALKRNQ